MNDDPQLTHEEKLAFERLSREATPSAWLEERVVRALRDDGTLLADSVAGRRRAGTRLESRWLRPWVVAAAMAASVVLFGAGAIAGHWLGARSTQEAMLAVREQDNIYLAQRVQEAGSVYVSALVSLGNLRSAARGGSGHEPDAAGERAAREIAQGREAALAAFYGAALELERLAPSDPTVVQILRTLENRPANESGWGARKTAWY